MSNKAQRFANAKIASQNSVQEADAAIYGSVAVPESGRQVAKPISIFDIYPDPVQPRRAVPSQAHAAWNGLSDGVPEMLKSWLALVEDERGKLFPLGDYLSPDNDLERPDEIGPLEASLLDLINLANDIHQNKLTNPVTVVKRENLYQLETGERRWLAYHLLDAMFQDDQWRKIPAREVAESSVWRQASENSTRADLNAISRARQLAILLMDLYRGMGTSFIPFHEALQSGECDRVYYAQVADGEEFRIPRGKGTELLASMGLKHPDQLRQYRALLRLPNELWVKADDENWDEYKIRSYTVTADTVLKPKKEKSEEYALFDRVKHLITKNPKDAHERQQALADIEELQHLLNDVKANLSTLVD